MSDTSTTAAPTPATIAAEPPAPAAPTPAEPPAPAAAAEPAAATKEVKIKKGSNDVNIVNIKHWAKTLASVDNNNEAIKNLNKALGLMTTITQTEAATSVSGYMMANLGLIKTEKVPVTQETALATTTTASAQGGDKKKKIGAKKKKNELR